MKIPHVLFTHLPPFTELQCFFQQSHLTTTGLGEIRHNGRGEMRDVESGEGKKKNIKLALGNRNLNFSVIANNQISLK